MASERERFGVEELATCLSHYDLGTVTSIREYPRGSRKAPKVLLECQRGTYLFKRRAVGKDDPAKVAFTHQIQLALAAQNFPLPHLTGTKTHHSSMLALNSRIYELFEFIPGGEYDGSPQATSDAGRILGLYHKLLNGFRSDYKPATGSYHGSTTIRQAIHRTAGTLPTDGRPPEVVAETVNYLDETYRHCGEKVSNLGLSHWERQIVHGDWHPGNMLFRDKHVAAVIDYDSARLYQRVIDLANGALQFSIIGGAGDPSKWPPQVDEPRFHQFMQGYDSVNVVSKREIEAIPYLMCEAMIGESVLPIAATGTFGRMEGFPFLQMVENKVRWILANLEKLHVALQQP